MARYEHYGVIEGMRERYIAIAVEIADALTVLAKATAGAPQRARQAALMAIAQIAAVQEKLSRETQRLPASREEQLALMQGVLQAQHGALLHLAEILKQLGGPAVGRIAGPRYPEPPLSLPPPVRYVSSAEPGRAVMVPRYAMVPHHAYGADYAASDRPLRRARRADNRSAAPRRRSPVRHISLVLKVVASRSLILVTIVASGLLVAYGTFPRASYRLAGTESAERPSDMKRRITPAPIPGTARSGGTTARRPLITSRDPDNAEAAPPPVSARMIGDVPAGVTITGSIPQPPPIMPGDVGAERRDAATGAFAPPQDTRARLTTAAIAPPANTGERGFVAVVFTNKDPATARRAFADLQGHFPNVLHRRQGELQTLDMGDKGVWYRLVVVPAGPREQAEVICRDLAAGGYDRCWVMAY